MTETELIGRQAKQIEKLHDAMTCPRCSNPTARPGWCESCEIEDQLAQDTTRARTHLCTVCRAAIVSPADGEDTCPACLNS